MKSVDTFVLNRKVQSATKISHVDRILANEYKTTSRASCSSASSYSNRDRIPNARHSKNLFCDETPKLIKSSDNSRKKLFLYASQVLGKLKKVGEKYNESHQLFTAQNDNQESGIGLGVQKLKLSYRKINFYHDLLKRLLEERCVLLLKEESCSCARETQKLVSDLKFLFTHETKKLTTMPIKSYNRFIDSSCISISILETLFKKVNYICDLHSSLKNNYQNIINFFHVGFDMELNQMLLKINKFQNRLYSDMLYWTHKVLEIFILKLCLADSDSVSPEFLHRVIEICDAFNLLFYDKKQINYMYLTNAYNVLFNCKVQSNSETILLDFLLQYLSHFEAKVASEKIIQYLIHECKNFEYLAISEQRSERDKKDVHITSSNTSDYYSASPTVIEDVPNITHISMTSSLNFESVFSSIIQRNQSLILKYLYSIICLDSLVPSDTNEHYSDSSTVNKAWNLPQSGFKSRSFVSLEEKYWICFWEKVLSFSLKLTSEVPCHQYGNAAAGVFLFWPNSYHHVIFKLLKFSIESKDLPLSGIHVTKKVFHTLLIHTLQESWDKNMSSSLSMIHGQYSSPIPVTNNTARTRIGNSLCLCLESLKTDFLKDGILSNNLYLQMFYPFEVTLDCFIFLTNIKTRASLSSLDLSTYLLISRSDCVYACKLLEESQSSAMLNRSDWPGFFSSSSEQKNCILKQIEILSGYISEAPLVMDRIISDAVRNNCMYKLKRNRWRIFNYNNSGESEKLPFTSVDEILSSCSNIFDHIFDGINVLYAITSAVATTLFSVLQVMHKNLNLKKIQSVREILNSFLIWLDQLNIEECDREKLKENKFLKKLLCIVHILESSSEEKRGYFGQMSNRIAPLIDVTPEESMILSEEERLYWRMHHKNICIHCF